MCERGAAVRKRYFHRTYSKMQRPLQCLCSGYLCVANLFYVWAFGLTNSNHHSSVCLTVTAHLCIGVVGALLMWFAAARFECLVVEIEKITNIRMLIVCIKKELFLRR